MRIVFALLGLASCTAAPQIVDTGCDWVRPVYVTSEDRISEPTAAVILGNNRKWLANCRVAR